MVTRQREKPAIPHIVALVELDMQKMWVRFVLAPAAIRERMRDLERFDSRHGEPAIQGASDDCASKNRPGTP